MAIPGFQDAMLPLLSLLADGSEHSMPELVSELTRNMKLSPAEVASKLPSGKQGVFANRVAWAKSYMKKAGLLSSPGRGKVAITEEGRKLLGEKPTRIDIKLLDRFDGFSEFRKGASQKAETNIPETPDQDETPEEAMERAYLRLRHELEEEVLRKVKSCSPGYFEDVVVKLLVAMGYGGSLADAGKAVGRSGDGGIDGIIKEDKLGLDVVYIQAKRWEGVVGRPEIQKFVGALAGQRASKGVFITTSGFSGEATAYASGVQQKVVLLNGFQLAELMIDHGLGVNTVAKFELKKIDSDFFEEE